jgi:very-short-patch-repair endonuclease
MADCSGLGAATLGVWSRASALAVTTRGAIDDAVVRGEWQRPWPAVYADAGYVLDPEQRALAAVMASGDRCPAPLPDGTTSLRLRAVAVGRTAARVWQMPLVDDDDPATGAREHLLDEVAVWQHGRTLRHVDGQGDARVLHRRRVAFAAGEVVQLPSGLWIASPARTLLDLAGRVDDGALVCAMDDALHRSLLSWPDLEACADRHASSRWCPRFRQAVRRSDARAESPGETLTRLLLLPVLPGLVPQVKVVDRAGRVLARLDLGDTDLELAVEFDGRRGHAGELMVAKDRRRDTVTKRQGWTTERLTWFEVRRRQRETRARMIAAAAALEAQRSPRPDRCISR